MSKRGFLNRMFSRLVSKLKKREYLIDETIQGTELIGIVWERFCMLIRGLFKKCFFRNAGRVFFCGRHCVLKSKGKISVGSGVTIHQGCRINALSKQGIRMGDNVNIGPECILECSGVITELGEGIVIEDNVGISARTFIGARADVFIGHDTIIGPYCSIHAENHIFSDPDTPIRMQPCSRKGVHIGPDCWIGAKATILDGVTIGQGCVIAAGAVVTKSLPDYAVAAGVPARIIKYRNA